MKIKISRNIIKYAVVGLLATVTAIYSEVNRDKERQKEIELITKNVFEKLNGGANS